MSDKKPRKSGSVKKMKQTNVMWAVMVRQALDPGGAWYLWRQGFFSRRLAQLEATEVYGEAGYEGMRKRGVIKIVKVRLTLEVLSEVPK